VIKLVEVRRNNRYTNNKANEEQYTLHEVYINPSHVVAIREDERALQHLREGLMPSGLDARQGFTKLHLQRGQNGLDITVIGDPGVIETKMMTSMQRVLLKG